MHKSYHRCPVHNDTMEHNRTRRNIVTGHLVHRKQNTPQPVEDSCICSSLHIQGAVMHKSYHRCPVHNDTMEHNRTRRNIVTGHLVHRKRNTPQPVKDSCICSSVNIHGNLVNVRYSHRCPIHNDTMEHNCTRRNIVTGCGFINLVQSNELSLMACTPQPVEDIHISSPQHIQAELPQRSDPEEKDCKRNILTG